MTISVEKAKERLAANRYDLNAWNALIKDALDKNIDQSREFFEELITQFPTCGRFWKIYIEQELKDKNYQNAEKLFEKCLNISNIDLWKCFLGYLRETKHNENGYNKIMIEAYDSALKKIGLDVMSYSIWQDYITFLKSLEANLESDAEKQTLYESIRKTYIEAHKTPMINIDQIWKDYILFENQLNPENARKLAEEMAKGFQSIKRISREYEHITRPLERHLPALPITKLPPPPVTPSSSEESSNNSGDQEMLRQSNAWKRYILWEKRNPLNLQNHQEVMKRVLFAYEQSFLCLAYNFDIWYEAASYLCQQKETLLKKSTGDRSQQLSEEEINDLTENAAANLFNRAINSFMKTNQLIHLVYAEFEERRKNYAKVHEIYEKYLQNQQVDPTLIWIHYIRFVMRSEDITAARKMFKRAREDPLSGYHLFIAQANLEYFHTKDKTIGFKILHLGAKKFSHEPEYMLAYIKYMNHLNEDNNTRVLFERILTNDDLLPQKTNEIWSEFLKFECSVGDLASILKVDRKRQKLNDSITTQHEMTPSMLMIDRYRYLDMLPCNSNELKAVGYKDTKLTNPQLTSTNNSTNISSLATNFSSNVNLTSNEMEIEVIKRKSKFPTPDFNQMLPFKPTRNALPGMMHSIAGGVFPFPPAVTDLVKRLPPPTSFEGPFVKVDELIKKIQEAEYHEDFQPLFVTLGGESMRDLENIAASMSAALNPNLQYTAPSKRSAVSSSVNNNNNSDDEDNKKVKTMDIYKQRQYKKLIKK